MIIFFYFIVIIFNKIFFDKYINYIEKYIEICIILFMFVDIFKFIDILFYRFIVD